MRIPAVTFSLDERRRRHGFLNKSLRDMPADERRLWAAWLSRHRVRSGQILVGTSIVCDDDRPCIEVQVVQRHRSTGRLLRRDTDGAVRTETVVVDLSVPASTMPGEPDWSAAVTDPLDHVRSTGGSRGLTLL